MEKQRQFAKAAEEIELQRRFVMALKKQFNKNLREGYCQPGSAMVLVEVADRQLDQTDAALEANEEAWEAWEAAREGCGGSGSIPGPVPELQTWQHLHQAMDGTLTLLLNSSGFTTLLNMTGMRQAARYLVAEKLGVYALPEIDVRTIGADDK